MVIFMIKFLKYFFFLFLIIPSLYSSFLSKKISKYFLYIWVIFNYNYLRNPLKQPTNNFSLIPIFCAFFIIYSTINLNTKIINYFFFIIITYCFYRILRYEIFYIYIYLFLLITFFLKK